MDELKQLLDIMRNENRQHFSGISQKIEAVKVELSELKSDVHDLRLSLDNVDAEVCVLRDTTVPDLRKDLEDEIKSLKQQRLAAELNSKKANLLFYGIHEHMGEDSEAVIRKFMKEELKHERDDSMIFANSHRLPTRSNFGKPRPIIVKFVQMKDRDSVLKLAPRLKDSTYKYGISPHLPQEMQQQRQKLLPIKRQAMASGKTAFIKTSGTEVKLFIDNVLYDAKSATSVVMRK